MPLAEGNELLRFRRRIEVVEPGVSLADAQVPDGAEVAVGVRGRREIFALTKPPCVTPSVR